MKTNIINTISKVQTLESGWNRLLENSSFQDVCYSYHWYNNWMNSFLSNKNPMIVAIEKNEQLISILPLYQEKIEYLKIKISALKSMTNWHSNRFDMLSLHDNEDVLKKTMVSVFAEKKHHLILLDHVPGESYLMKWLKKVCADMKYKYTITEHSTNCLVQSPPTFYEFFNKLDGKFRRNINAAERKALSRGHLTLRCLKDESELTPFLERGFAIEASGWKGDNRTAVVNCPLTKKFYEGIAKDFIRQGKFKAFLLENGSDDLAFLYCVEGFGAVRALKIGANDKFKYLGPGMLITKEVLAHLIDKGSLNIWDFCGGEARWKRDWGNATEKLYTITIFNNSLVGKALYTAGHFAKKTLT